MSASQTIYVTKANGEREYFDERKILRSIKRAHIPEQYHDQVLSTVKQHLYNGIPTHEVYTHIKHFFHHHYPQGACTYNLKHAVLQIGPSGYPFEKLIGAILFHKGYSVEIDKIVRGKCVSHEIDVLAEKRSEEETKRLMIECKFHNQPGQKCTMKTALYVQARFQDVSHTWNWEKSQHAYSFAGVLATNTKCSTEAVAYAQCVGLEIISWGYPQKGSLQDLLEETKLYPITSLCSLSRQQIELLLEKNIILVRDLYQHPKLLQELQLNEKQYQHLMLELKHLEKSRSEKNIPTQEHHSM